MQSLLYLVQLTKQTLTYMSNNKIKFTLGIIATTGVVAFSAVANAESAKSSVVSNILNRANLNIALSQSTPARRKPTNGKIDPNTGKVTPTVNPNTGKVTPSLEKVPGKGKTATPSAEDVNLFCDNGCGSGGGKNRSQQKLPSQQRK
jgi:hypothetical protein